MMDVYDILGCLLIVFDFCIIGWVFLIGVVWIIGDLGFLIMGEVLFLIGVGLVSFFFLVLVGFLLLNIFWVVVMFVGVGLGVIFFIILGVGVGVGCFIIV